MTKESYSESLDVWIYHNQRHDTLADVHRGYTKNRITAEWIFCLLKTLWFHNRILQTNAFRQLLMMALQKLAHAINTSESTDLLFTWHQIGGKHYYISLHNSLIFNE